MTEAEWLACRDPMLMFGLLWDGVSDRRLRLFAVACCRVMIAGADEPSATEAVNASELFADGMVSDVVLRVARRAATDDWNRSREGLELRSNFLRHLALGSAYQVSRPSAQKVVQEISMLLRRPVGGVSSDYQVALFRDILGNPFRPVTLAPAWLTSDVVALAEGIYQERAFDRMPILADALQDAGCDSDDILTHCRDPKQVHVRGCWVIDMLTGRK